MYFHSDRAGDSEGQPKEMSPDIFRSPQNLRHVLLQARRSTVSFPFAERRGRQLILFGGLLCVKHSARGLKYMFLI